jgi:hypothetical protein
LTERRREIKGKTKYIICTRSKSQHKKAIEVCHQCLDRYSCDEYQEIQQTDAPQAEQHELFQNEHPEFVQDEQPEFFYDEQPELIQDEQPEFFQDAEPELVRDEQPELIQALNTLLDAVDKKRFGPKSLRHLKKEIKEIAELYR